MSFDPLSRFFFVTGGLLVALGGVSSLHADPQVGPPERPVVLNILVVHAGTQPGPVDPLCRELKQKLGLMNFKTMRMMQQERFKLRMGQEASMDLPEGQRFEVLPISVIDKELHMQVGMPGHVNTRVRMPSGQSVIMGGLEHEGGVLFLQLRPEFRLRRAPSPALAQKRMEREQRDLGAADASTGQ